MSGTIRALKVTSFCLFVLNVVVQFLFCHNLDELLYSLEVAQVRVGRVIHLCLAGCQAGEDGKGRHSAQLQALNGVIILKLMDCHLLTYKNKNCHFQKLYVKLSYSLIIDCDL